MGMETSYYRSPDGSLRKMAIWILPGCSSSPGPKFCFGPAESKDPWISADSRTELGFKIVQAGYRIKG